MKRLIWTIAALLMLTGISTAQDNDKPNVVATTTQAGDAVLIIAEDTVKLTQLMGAGVDPHLYKPTESDIAAMNRADLVIFSGLNLEGQFESVLDALGETNTRVLSLGKPVQDLGFTIGGFNLSSEFQNVDDPHFWFDPRNWQISVEALTDELIALSPENEALYTENRDAYLEQLQLLYEWGVEASAQIPEEQRILVTSHDAFQYFSDAFGFEVVAIQGLSTADEAGVSDLQSVVNYVVKKRVPVMFVESSVPPNTIESVQEAAAAQGFEVRIGVRVLFSDAMGAEDSFGGTYMGMLAENIITILQSFGYDILPFPEGLNLTIPEDLLEVSQ